MHYLSKKKKRDGNQSVVSPIPQAPEKKIKIKILMASKARKKPASEKHTEEKESTVTGKASEDMCIW